jgi:hypothetical protein
VAQDLLSGKPVEVPALVLETPEDVRRDRDAHARRGIRLERARIKRERLVEETRKGSA